MNKSLKKLCFVFGAIAVALFLLSFIVSNSEVRIRREARKVERKIERRQKVIDSYAKKAMEVPANEWLQFEDFPDDMVLYKYNADTLQSWINQFSISNDEVDVYPLWYRLHYMSNGNLFNTPLAYINNEEQYINLGSAWYIIKTYTHEYSKIITGILIKTEFPSDNQSVISEVNKHLKLNKKYTTVSLNEGSGTVIRGMDNVPLFAITPAAPSYFSYNNSPLRWIALLFVLFALLVYHAWKRSWASLAISMFGLIVIRGAAIMLSQWVDPTNSLFSPVTYADTIAFNSIGSLLFNNLFVFCIVIILFLARLKLYKLFIFDGKEKRVFFIVLISLFTAFLIAYIHLTLRSLIKNSTIVLNIANINEFSFYSALSYLSYATLFLALIYCLQILCRSIWVNRKVSMFSWENTLIYIAIISLYTVVTINVYGLKKEYETNWVWTNKLSVERDLGLELQLRGVEGGIASDQLLAMLTFLPQVGNEMIERRIMERYFFNNVSRKYNISITTCSENSQLLIDRFTPTVNCYEFYSDETKQYGIPLYPSSNFMYLNNYNGQTSYIGVFTYLDYSNYKTAKLFIEIESKYTNDDIGYDIIDFTNSSDNQKWPKHYSYAKYCNGKMVSNSGNYNYPVTIGANDYKIGYSMRKKGGYIHFTNKFSDDEMVILSRPRYTFLPYLVTFSYLLIFYGIIILLFTRWGRRSKLLSLPKYSFKRKITLLLTTSLVIALLSTGIGSIIYSLKASNSNNNLQMEEKVKIVQSSLSDFCQYALRYNELNTPQLFDAMDRVASNTQSDINLYDTHGRLIRSTKPAIFEQFLMGSRMNDKAFYEIVKKHSMRYIGKEKIANMNFFSIYAPLFNVDGKLVAIANIPYFLRSSDMRDDVTSTIAMIVNIYLLLIIATTLGGIMVSNSISRPLTEIKKKMEGLIISKKNEHIIYNKRDELGILVSAYNKMVDDLDESTRQLAETERQEAWKEMARQIAHEIKNPLTPMRLSIQHMMRLKQKNIPGWENKLEELSQSLIEQIDILSETAGEFSSFSKFYNEELCEEDLCNLVHDQAVLFNTRDSIKMEFCFNVDSAPVMIRKKQIVRVFVNLISNGIQAVENKEDGILRVSLDRDGNYYKVDIEDNGPGVSEENYSKLFKPNFTTKSSGTGLGLAISHSIIEQSRGSISYSTSSLGGACFTVRLPAMNDIA